MNDDFEELEETIDDLIEYESQTTTAPPSLLSEQTLSQLRRLMELRDEKDQTKLAAAKAAAAYADAESAAFESLSGIRGSIKPNLGPPWGYVQFSARETHFGRVYDAAKAKAYFEEMQMTSAMSEPKFVKKRLNEIARDCREQGTTPPPGIDWTTNRGVTITRQKGS